MREVAQVLHLIVTVLVTASVAHVGRERDALALRVDSLEARAAAVAATPEPRAVFVRAAIEARVPPQLFLALIQVESAADSAAVSWKGATGAGQVMVDEHENLIVSVCGERERIMELACNARVSAQILRGLYLMHDDWGKALVAYNGATRYPQAAARYLAQISSALGPRHGLF